VRRREAYRAERRAALLLAILLAGCGKDPAGLMEEGKAAFELGLLPAALERYEEVAETHAEEFPEVYEKIGDVHAAAKRYDQALEAWTRARELRPENANLLNKIGAYLLQTGKVEEAVAAFEAAVAADPEAHQAVFNLGVVALQAGDFAASMEHFDSALELSPEDAAILKHRGIALERLGQRGEAAESYLRAFRSDPERAGDAGRIYRFLVAAEHWAGAVEVGQSLVAGSNDPELLASFAYVSWLAGDEARGRQIYEGLNRMGLPPPLGTHVRMALEQGPAELSPPFFGSNPAGS